MFYLGPGDQVWPHLNAKLKLKMLYAFSSGFYTYSIFALCFWETRRKDFGVSMTHHVGALGLLIVSYIVNLQRAGSVILAVHDASDVFLEVGKLTKYSGLDYVPEIAFGLFAVSWILLRLLYFPVVLVRSTTYEVLVVLDKDKYPNGPYLYYILNTLLICLLVLHVYWWILIWRMIKKQIQNSGKVSDDVRSDSDSDSDVDEDKDKKE
jgi:ceramide synthetase